MNLGTILVHLDYAARCEVRVDLAASLARKNGSHLVGLVPTGSYDSTQPAVAIDADDSEYVVARTDRLRLRTAAITHVFRAQIRGPGPLSHDVRHVDGATIDAVVRHGRASDLVIVGQTSVDEIDHAEGPVLSPGDLPEQVVLHSGRPVLIIPRTGHFQEVGKNVLVAWDGTREAAVALRDALPLLGKASTVTLVSVCNAQDSEEKLGIAPTIAWLSRHGIQATAEGHLTANGLADTLLACAARMSADLIVMGGYGHTHLRERVLGGVTREILARMNVPVLMAH